MSVVQPYTPAQVEAWRQRDAMGWEPVTLALPGWSISMASGLPNERAWRFSYQAATASLIRHWDRPLSPGGPMVVASTRSVTTPDGSSFQVQTTSVFHGTPKVVDVVFLNGADWLVQLVFEGCPAHVVDDALHRLHVTPPQAPSQIEFRGGGLPEARACDVILETRSIRMPARCSSCGAPQQTTLNISSRKAAGLNRSVRRTFAIPYCLPCAERARSARTRKLAASCAAFGMALLFAGFALVAPGLPVLLLVPISTIAAIVCAIGMTTALTPRAPPPPATAAGEAVKLVSFSGQRSILHCVNPDWAAELARANGTIPTPRQRRTHFATKALLFSALLTPLAALVVWLVANPAVYIDNAGPETLAIWLDGVIATSAPPSLRSSKPMRILVPYGTHRFGYSTPGASKPQGSLEARVTMLDAHLYNPGKTACYWLVANSYGSVSVAGISQGPQPIREFYSFDKVDTWFDSNPQTIQVSSGQRGDTRVALQRAEACMELAERGCDSEARARFIDCERAATSEASRAACADTITCGARGAAVSDRKLPPPVTVATPRPAPTHAASAAPHPSAAPAKSR